MAGYPDPHKELPAEKIHAVAGQKRNHVTVFIPDALKLPKQHIGRLIHLAQEDVKGNLGPSLFKRLHTDSTRIANVSGVEPGLEYEFQLTGTWGRYDADIARVMNATFREYFAQISEKPAGVTDDKILDEMEIERRDRITVIPSRRPNEILVFFPHSLGIYPADLDRLMEVAKADLVKQEMPTKKLKKNPADQVNYYGSYSMYVTPIKPDHHRGFLDLIRDKIKGNPVLDEPRFGHYYILAIPQTTGGENFSGDIARIVRETMQYFTSLREMYGPNTNTDKILETMEKAQKEIKSTKVGNNRYRITFHKYDRKVAENITDNIVQALQAEGIEVHTPHLYYERHHEIFNYSIAAKNEHNAAFADTIEKVIQRILFQFSAEEHIEMGNLAQNISVDNQRRLALRSSLDKQKAQIQKDIETMEAVIIGQIGEIFEKPENRPWEKSDKFKGKDSDAITHEVAAMLAPAIIASFKGKGTNKASLLVVADHTIRDVMQREFNVSPKEALAIGFKLTQEEKGGLKESSLEKAIADYCDAHARRKG